MTYSRAHQQVSLYSVLALAEHGPIRSGELTAQIAELESTGEQAARNAITLALRCELIERVPAPTGKDDRRQRYYALSEFGRFLLKHAAPSPFLRHARQLRSNRSAAAEHDPFDERLRQLQQRRPTQPTKIPDHIIASHPSTLDAIACARAVLVGDRSPPGEDQASSSS